MILCLVLGSLSAMAQSDSLLYRAYEKGAMGPWRKYVDRASENWQHLTDAQRLRLISYEYGFVSSMIEYNKEQGAHYLALFEEHVGQMESQIPQSTLYCYQSSICAYHYLINNIQVKNGLRAKELAAKAYNANPNDPLALTLYGSILFEAPKVIGGDKPMARRLFLKADSIYNTMPAGWNWQRISLNVFLEKSKKY